MHYNFVCIEGNIGIGKTTLTKKLADHYGVPTLFEEFHENPWLPLFYQDPKEAALALELSFLTDRSKQLLKVKPGEKLFADYCLDKCLLFTDINLPPADLSQYKKLHSLVSRNVVSPDLVIVIHSTVNNLRKNIKQRNRSYEMNLEAAYLEKLNEAYKEFFSEERPYNILNIFTEDLNAARYDSIFDQIVKFLGEKPSAKITSIKL